jgi:hypothetical protein
MDQVTLYKHSDESISITIWAYIRDDALVIAGQDLDTGGSNVSAVWGDSEYEYFYSLSPDDTQKLQALLIEETKIDRELLFLVDRFFAGGDVCARFREYCEKHGLVVKFYSC